jgi:NAD(P)-dependent dehydrogenase (short-subunit alcohol dehydrogenase family)
MNDMRLLALLLAVFTPVWISTPASELDSPDGDDTIQRAVLVTGASSGIGRATAELLASQGFYVYAGARKQHDLDELDSIENMQGVRLDVTIPEEIEAAVETVRAGGRGLYGLINNAGVVVVAPLIEVTEEDLTFQLDVNVFGPYRVTKAFAPLLIESKGRVSTTGSISGTVTWGLGGPYTMSKHAIEAYTDCLAAELAPFGVSVSVIDPGNYKSRISANMHQRLIDRGYSTEGSLYKAQMERLLDRPDDRDQHQPPTEVAQAFLHALTAEQPRRRYMVVPNQREAEMTIRSALARVVSLNEGQQYAYDREQLIAMLDEALAQ